jgi:hypothetical protein
MTTAHAHTSSEIALLRGATPADRTVPWILRGRAAPRRRRVGRFVQEHPQLTIFAFDADEITSQLTRTGWR